MSTFHVRWSVAAALTLLCAAGAVAQNGPPRPVFDVTSVKATSEDQRGSRLNCSSGGGFAAWSQSLQNLIEWAYDLPFDESRLSGGPNWINSAVTFQVEGKSDHRLNAVECRQMVHSLLAGRFGVVVHWETKELPVYLLSVSNKGSKMRPANDSDALSLVTVNGDELQFGDGFATTSGRRISMRQLSRYLAARPMVGRTVVDKTGLEGYYGFELEYATNADDIGKPDIFAALPEQLGLRLEPSKGPVEILVIDRAEKPSEN